MLVQPDKLVAVSTYFVVAVGAKLTDEPLGVPPGVAPVVGDQEYVLKFPTVPAVTFTVVLVPLQIVAVVGVMPKAGGAV